MSNVSRDGLERSGLMAVPTSTASPAPEVSVVIPFFNEEENVTPMLEELYRELTALGRTFEVIGVDDGSHDATFAVLSTFAARERSLRILRFRRNYGQTAAMSAGIDAARGDVIIPMDGDRQNDPADIATLLATLDGASEGAAAANASGRARAAADRTRFDVVSGWRKNRQDKEFGRKLPSRIANRLISAISGVTLHDYGCTLKAYRRDVLTDVRLYGEMHRFIPVYASWNGARVTEMVVNHRARTAGKSKYGLGRTGKVILDLMVVKFLASYTTNPIYLFGGFGLASLVLSGVLFAAALFFKLAGLKDLVQTPLPLLAVLFGVAGILSVLMGLLAELLVRTYYESQGKRPYAVVEELNRPSAGES